MERKAQREKVQTLRRDVLGDGPSRANHMHFSRLRHQMRFTLHWLMPSINSIVDSFKGIECL